MQRWLTTCADCIKMIEASLESQRNAIKKKKKKGEQQQQCFTQAGSTDVKLHIFVSNVHI